MPFKVRIMTGGVLINGGGVKIFLKSNTSNLKIFGIHIRPFVSDKLQRYWKKPVFSLASSLPFIKNQRVNFIKIEGLIVFRGNL